MRRTVAVLTTIQILTATTLFSQAAPNQPLALAGLGTEAMESGPEPAFLKASYRVHLASDWPQLALAGTDCVNGGNEVLTGTLSRTTGGYSGRLERNTSIQFCGAHGPLSLEPCSLTLTSRGPVTARAEVVLAGSRAVVTLRWAAERTAQNDITVEGTCAPGFNQSLKDLYLGVTHALEFPLPRAGEGGVPIRLEDYGWIVAVW